MDARDLFERLEKSYVLVEYLEHHAGELPEGFCQLSGGSVSDNCL
jgi:hypothetical protein